MRETRTSLANGRKTILLVGAAVLLGCADLAMEARSRPTEMVLSPRTGLLTVGNPTKVQLVVKDQHGEVMAVPSWVSPTWSVSDASVAEVGQDGTLTGTSPGRVAVTARLADLTASAGFRMNPNQILLTAPVIYLNQGAQNRSGGVSLIADRPALLRVFVVGDRLNWLEAPLVQVTLQQGDEVVFERLVAPETSHIPTDIDESNLWSSYDVEVPGSFVRPGVRMVVELDPEGVVPLAPGSRTRYPEEGSMELVVVEPQLLRQVFVPTMSPQSDERVYEWTDGVDPESPQVRHARGVMPVGTMEIEVRETYRTNADLTTAGGWYQWIREMSVLFQQEGRRGYYYGVASIGRPAFGGLGYVGYPVSVGLPNGYIYAHELGHNMNLWHAPCGGAGGTDPDFPHGDGSIGIWGYDIYDIFQGQLLDPARYKDVMSYCGPAWVSDYHFSRATDHRLAGDGGVDLDGGTTAPGGPDRGEMLVVWGSVGDGRVALDPAFVLEGPQALPEADGPYRVEGIGIDGRTEFSLSFSPTPLEFGGGGFVFFVPYEREWADNLDRMVLTGPDGSDTLARDGESPLAVVTDRSTGRIRAIIRQWDGGAVPGESTAEVVVTRGIPRGG